MASAIKGDTLESVVCAPSSKADPPEEAGVPATKPRQAWSHDPAASRASGTSVWPKHEADLRLCTTSYFYTFAASFVAAGWITTGLVVLGAAERGDLPHAAVVLLRIGAWILIYQIPCQCIAIMDVRGLAFFGSSGSKRCSVLTDHGFTPSKLRHDAQIRNLNTTRAVLLPLVIHSVWVGIYILFIAVYIGEQMQHMGVVLIYGVGHILVVFAGDTIVPKMHPPRDEDYAMATGPPSFGFIMIGFFIGTAGYALLKRQTGAWLGLLMPPIFGSYEVLGTVAISNIIASKLVEKPEVAEAYKDSKQGLYPSCIISLLHAMAEGARLTLLLCDAANKASGLWMVAIPASLVWNVLTRTFYIHHLANISLQGKLPVSHPGMLLQDVKFTMGYPRFFAILSIVLARLCLGNPVVPHGQETLAYVVIAMLVAEVFEDVVVSIFKRRGWLAPVEFRNVEKIDELEIRSMAKLRLEKIKKARRKDQSTRSDASTPAPIDENEDARMEEDLAKETQKVEDRLTFFSASGDFGVQPYWCHFSSTMIAQFHMVLFLIIFTNGVSYVLGFCSEVDYTGVRRGILWWPLPQESNLCA